MRTGVAPGPTGGKVRAGSEVGLWQGTQLAALMSHRCWYKERRYVRWQQAAVACLPVSVNPVTLLIRNLPWDPSVRSPWQSLHDATGVLVALCGIGVVALL